jgi:hypothetical protein
LGSAFITGAVALLPYAFAAAMVNISGLSGLAAGAMFAGIAGSLDIFAGNTYLPVFGHGNAKSQYVEDFDKQWSVYSEKFRDKLTGTPNSKEIPLGVRDYFKAQGWHIVTEALPFAPFFVVQYAPIKEPTWVKWAAKDLAGNVAAGAVGVLALQVLRVCVDPQNYEPKRDKDAWKHQVQALKSYQADIQHVLDKTEDAEARDKIGTLLKKVTKDLRAAELGEKGVLAVSMHNVAQMFSSRKGMSQWAGRVGCLLIAPVCAEFGAAAAVPALVVIGFGLRNEVSKPFEVLLAIPAAIIGAVKKCAGGEEEDDDDPGSLVDMNSYGQGGPELPNLQNHPQVEELEDETDPDAPPSTTVHIQGLVPDDDAQTRDRPGAINFRKEKGG